MRRRMTGALLTFILLTVLLLLQLPAAGAEKLILSIFPGLIPSGDTVKPKPSASAAQGMNKSSSKTASHFLMVSLSSFAKSA